MNPEAETPIDNREWLSDEFVSSAVVEIRESSGLSLSKDQVRNLAERLGNLFNVVGFDRFDEEGTDHASQEQN
jgi:hypothetical protein